MKIYKYEGLGNDFIITETMPKNIEKICSRHFGVGADGLIVSEKKENRFFMRFFNADGSVARMCGNGIRCYANYLESKYENITEIDTLSGIKQVKIVSKNDNEMIVSVNMGKCKDLKKIDYLDFDMYFVDSGTEHTVVFTKDDVDIKYCEKYGSIIEKLPIFPNKTNVNFVPVSSITKKSFKMYTFEKGVGITNACGTGAVACSYVVNRIFKTDKILDVKLLGGELKIEINDDKSITMTGYSKKIFEGEYYEEI